MTEFPFIQIPVEDEFDNPAVILDSRQLADMLEELPLLNLQGSIKTVVDEITPSNSRRMSAKNRLALLEVYRQTATNLYPSAEEASLARQPISTDQRESIKANTGILFRELANGYKLLFRQAWDDNNTDLATLACFRSIEMLGFCVLHSYRRYIDITPGILLDMHRIYLYCRQSGISHKPVVFEKTTYADKNTDLLYKQLMLTSISDPYHLPSGAITRLFAMARPLAELCTLASDDRNIAADQFLIDLDRDTPPVSLKRGVPQSHSKFLLLLDIQPALESASDRLQELASSGSVVENNEQRLLGLMLSKFLSKPARKSDRMDTNYSSFFTTSIDSIHHFLREDNEQLQQGIIKAAANHFTRDIDRDDDSVHLLEQWNIINESLQGIGLHRPYMAQLNPQVGELACIINNNRETPHFTLIAIQWLRRIKDTIKLGAEIIPGIPHPVNLMSQESSEPVHAILLDENTALQLPATLIAPRGSYAPDRQYSMRMVNGYNTNIRCNYIIRDTPWFEYFSWQKA